MSDQNVRPNKYGELRNKYKYYIDLYNALYQLKTEKEEELKKIYKKIQTELIDSKRFLPQRIVEDILNIIPCNNRYTKSYLSLAKFICDDYHVKEINRINPISNFFFYKEYGIKLDKSCDFEKINTEELDILTTDTIYRAIMNNDLKRLISFTEREGFDKDKELYNKLYQCPTYNLSYLDLCCYYGAIDCFKFLRTKFNSEITRVSLEFSFLGGNPDIMSECLKYQKPDMWCMIYAIISHNIDFVTFLMNEYNLDVKINNCPKFKNLESLFVYFDKTNDINNCFAYSAMFNIPSLCEYFLSLGADIHAINDDGQTALFGAASNNSYETAKFLLSQGADTNEKNRIEMTALHISAKNNYKELVKLLISHGANVDEKTPDGRTPLHLAIKNNCTETIELLLSLGANINEKNICGTTVIHTAAYQCRKEIAEVLISHGANINEKGDNGKPVLHEAAYNNSTETAELLISHGIDINEKDNDGQTALHIATDIDN
ncbi:ankyrin repeat protein, putative [Trichomonas vaginalis G3]|uniref:Ankyrin repeat protein, putative n=1 Tax=Trichomonas vaginalis (strain ATCC PRA-98 / G3) TaxID=412133 RepID=A2DCS9_TRIV3|nr:spectrin binding [Trichomonas vaginalis G3]EAY21703.1 ankyrin repeat protein, putative [Trichomonas vaginalis G3]KAI5524318.1 spectrin binding [Trichomonas vaginalis G3]|eukprot:XP_001582689.1 ankyrin repeat protein [Trichomonas vaginalis G3]